MMQFNIALLLRRYIVYYEEVAVMFLGVTGVYPCATAMTIYAKGTLVWLLRNHTATSAYVMRSRGIRSRTWDIFSFLFD